MAFLDNISKKISVTGQTVAQKAKGMADITGLKSQISDEQKKLDKYYRNLGELYYNLKKDEPLPDLQELVALIKNSYYKIDEINKAISAIENIRNCPVCGAVLENNMIFCVGCGARIPEPGAPKNYGTVSETKFCTNCGSEIPKQAAFCVECGQKQE